MSSKEVDGQVSMFAAQYDMSVVIMLMYDKFGERRARVAQLYRSEPSELHCDAPSPRLPDKFKLRCTLWLPL